MRAVLFGGLVAAVGLASGCQTTDVGAQNGAGTAQTIKLADGRQVFFHEGVNFGGFYQQGNPFKLAAVLSSTTVTATANAAGFIALVTLSATPAGTIDIWLGRQGSAMGSVIESASNGGTPAVGCTVQANYASTYKNNNQIALQVPAGIPAGTFGVAVADNPSAGGFTSGTPFTAAQVKTAFTVTDNILYRSVVYTAGAEVPAKANF